MAAKTFKCEGKIGSGKGVTLARSAAPLIRSIRKMPVKKHILITLRCSAYDKAFIAAVAHGASQSLSEFVLKAALNRARKVNEDE